MTNLIIGIATVTAILVGTVTFTSAWITGAGRSSDAVAVASDARGHELRVSLAHVRSCVIPLGGTVEFSVENDGGEPLRAFGDWDVIAHYSSGSQLRAERLTYTSSTSPSAGEWTLKNIRLPSGRVEAFGSGVLDPGEEATVVAVLAAGATASSLNTITLASLEGARLEVTFDGVSGCGFFLHNNPTPPTGDTNAQANLAADPTYPSVSTLYNYDADRDALAGLVLVRGGSGAAEATPTKYQNWRTTVLTQALQLSGTVRVDFWAAVTGFDTVKRGDVTVYLRDYDGASYTEIGNVDVSANPWDAAASGTFVKATAAITGLNYTVPKGNRLEIKLVVPAASGDDMWFAYDTLTYPMSLTYAETLTALAHADTQRTGDVTSYLAKTSHHDDGYYLHNNPSPPTEGTNSQANLSATIAFPSAGTLFNYDLDRDAQPGRVLLQGGSGAGEADLAKYQNWRTDLLTTSLKIKGDVSLNLWAAVKDFNTSLAGELKVFLRDYDGASYTEITNGTLTASPWDASATGTWVNRRLEMKSVDYTLAAGHRLELKVIVGSGSGGDMWLAYDTAGQASVLRLPGQRDGSPGGRPKTATASAGASTGRFSPDLNGGRVLFPLRGYTRVTDAPWTVDYRVKRDGYGFTWLSSAVDVTPASSAAWVTIDLSASVPVGTTGAIVEVVNTHPSAALSGVVRGGDDTIEYMPDASSQKIGGRSHRWQIVKVNANREIQGYTESNADVLFKLVGYTIGTDPFYWTAPKDITPATTGSWTTVDVSSYAASDTTGVVLMLDATGNAVTYGVRETGSSFSATTFELPIEGNTMYLVGIDGADKFDIYLADSTVKVYLVARTAQSVGFYVNDVAVTDPSLNSWQQIDADTYSVPAAANGLILFAQNNQNKRNDFGLRLNGSTDDWDKGLWSNGQFQGGVGIDSGNIWEQYQGAANVDVSIAAYTTAVLPSDADIHADLDVLVRKANGVVRTTLGTNVANSPNITASGWTTVTGTWTPAEYVVVDPTDYLEFDLFAEVTRNDGSNATVDFRIDDNTLEVADQTGVSNLALTRP